MLHHLKWIKTGRLLLNEKGQNVWKSSVGQQNVDLGNDEFVPYVRDDKKHIYKFADCELRLTETGVEFWQAGEKLIETAFYPEIKEGSLWNRKTAIANDLVVAEDEDRLTSVRKLNVSYKVSTEDQESIVRCRFGSGKVVVFNTEIKSKAPGLTEQRLLWQLNTSEKGKLVEIANPITGEKLGPTRYVFDKFRFTWREDEIQDHKIEEKDNERYLALKQGNYQPQEIRRISPTTWTPGETNQDCFTAGATYYDHYNNEVISGEYSSDDWIIGWKWDACPATGTADDGCKITVNINTDTYPPSLLVAANDNDITWASDGDRPDTIARLTETVSWTPSAYNDVEDTPELKTVIQDWITNIAGNGDIGIIMYPDNIGANKLMYSHAEEDVGGAEITVVYTGGQIYELSASVNTVTGAATPDLSVLRVLSASIAGGSSVPDTVTLNLLRALAASIGGGSSVPDTVKLAILRQVSGAIAAGSVTPDDVALIIIKVFSASIQTGTAVPDDVTLNLMKALTASIQGASDTSAAAVAVMRTVSAAIAAQSSAADDVTLLIAGVIELSAAISAASTTPDTVVVDVLRELSASVTAGSTASDEATLAVLREVSSSVVGTSVTPDDVALILLKMLAASIQPTTQTATASIKIVREITGAVEAGSSTPSAVLSVLRKFSASVNAETVTSVVTLILQALGVITDAILESLTVKRTISSLTAQREMESLTPERSIEEV